MPTDSWQVFAAGFTPVAHTTIWHLTHAEVQRLIEAYVRCRKETP